MEQPKPKPMIGLFEALYTSRALRRLTPDSIPDRVGGGMELNRNPP